jgi:hypothetical protein
MATCHRQRLEVFPKTDNFADPFETLVPRCLADIRATSTEVNLSSDSPENIPRTASEFCSYGESWKEGRTGETMPGTYLSYCKVHPKMTAKVVVQ